jgi:hypothetical protein
MELIEEKELIMASKKTATPAAEAETLAPPSLDYVAIGAVLARALDIAQISHGQLRMIVSDQHTPTYLKPILSANLEAVAAIHMSVQTVLVDLEDYLKLSKIFGTGEAPARTVDDASLEASIPQPEQAS